MRVNKNYLDRYFGEFFYFSMCHDTLLFKYAEKMCNNITKREQTDVDPPIPPGMNYVLKKILILKNTI